MKIMFISDIHANYNALGKIESYIDKSDITYCLGDVTGYNKDVNEVINFLRQKNVISVLGNHDYYVLNQPKRDANENVIKGIEYAKNNITKDNLDWLSKLPNYREFCYDNIKFYICHGSPWNNIEEYIYPDSNKIEKIFDLPYNVICLGHTHRPMLIEKNDKIFCNPGSVGQSRQKKDVINFAIFDTKDKKFTTYELTLKGTV